MSRLNNFDSLRSHPIIGKLFNRLTKEEVETCRSFIRENELLDSNEFAHKVNRWMLDAPKPKRYSDMWALVSQSGGMK